MSSKLCGIILAAGEGKRAGGGKLSRIIDGKPMLQYVVETAVKSSLDSVILVTGCERELGENLAQYYGIKSYYNPNYKLGMSTSLKLGVSNIPATSLAFMVFLGDMPYVKGKTVETIIDSYKATKGRIIIPLYKEKQGHPVLLSCAYKCQILKTVGDIGAREIVNKNPKEILYIRVDDEGVVRDIDY